MRIIFLDYETMYDDQYSLRKMTPAEYILHPRFECHGCAIKEGLRGAGYWLDGPDLPGFFTQLPTEVMLVSHNALFDACITAWIYGFVPKVTSCTLSIARATLGHLLKSMSLQSVSTHLGLGGKTGALIKVKGLSLQQIKAQPWLYQEYVAYGINDVEKCAGIFEKLVYSGALPAQELAVLDMVIRCATQPVFELDQNMLAEHLHEVQQNKLGLLAKAGIHEGNRGELMSNDQFALMLRRVGIEPPMKVSPTTGRQTFAFAKTDVAFLDLLEHDNPMVQTLVAARMGEKSTIEETRSQRFINLSHLTLRGNQGLMPMPLRYAAAHTHRLGGDWKLNVQNLTRGGKLRKSLKAPPGHKVVTVDASQIEARLNGWFCGCDRLTNQFANGEDVYSNFASSVFEISVNKTDNPTERFVGKQSILGLGFGLGWMKFQARLASDSENQTGTRIELNDETALKVVTKYRTEFHEVKSMWNTLNYQMIPLMAGGGSQQLGPVIFEKNLIRLPSLTGEIGEGLKLYYHNLRHEDGEWWFNYGAKKKRLYGGKLLENIIQALDRVIVMGAGLRIQQCIAPYRMQQQAHDENAYVIREEHVTAVDTILMEEMTRRPVWAPTLPLAAETGVGHNYGEAK